MKPIVALLSVFIHITSYTQNVEATELTTWENKLKAATADSVKAEALFNIGALLYSKDNIQARQRLREAVDFLKDESKHIRLRAQIYHYLAAINNDRGNYTIAMSQFMKAKAQFEIVHDSLEIANIYYNMAVLHHDQGNLEDAEDKIFKAIAINTKYKDTFALAYNYSILGEHYGNLKKVDSAFLAFDKSEIFYKASKNEGGLNDLKSHKAKLYADMGDYEKSIALLKACVEYSFNTDIPQYRSIYTNKIAKVYKKKKDYANALKYSDSSLSIALKHNHRQLIVDGYLQQSEIEAALGNYKSAYEHAKLHKVYSDSVFNKRNTRKIKELELRHEFQKEKELKDAQIETLAIKNKVKQQWLIFGSIGLLVLFAMVYLIRSRKFAIVKQALQEQFSQDLINGQEEERSRLARELHDSVGQKLMLLSKTATHSGNDDTEALAKDTLEEVRSISRGLHPSNLERLGLTEAINALVYHINANTNLFFTETIDNIDNVLPKASELHVYRIIQETLSNIVKHSEAKAVKMEIQKQTQHINIVVSDNGKGFDFESKYKTMSLGLKTLYERAKIIGAKIKMDSENHKGTNVMLNIPI